MSFLEIERKFLVKKMPLYEVEVLREERYFLYIDEHVEIRVQERAGKYFLERKTRDNGVKNEKVKIELSAPEFSHLQSMCTKSLVRDIVHLADGTSLKIYHGEYEGLLRAEFEFENTTDALNFQPPEWCGEEITDSELGRDSKLVQFSRTSFLHVLEKISK